MKELLTEWLLTFSNRKSNLSSKRIERFAVFTSMLLATITYLCMGIFKCNLAASDLIMIVGVWLGYAGFNTIQIKKDGTETDS